MAVQDTSFDIELSERYWKQMYESVERLLATTTGLAQSWAFVDEKSENIPATGELRNAAEGALETVKALYETAQNGLRAHKEYVQALEQVQSVHLDL